LLAPPATVQLSFTTGALGEPAQTVDDESVGADGTGGAQFDDGVTNADVDVVLPELFVAVTE
jgi:hypothetical protein